MRMLKRSAMLGLVAAGALALAACGGDSDDDTPDPTDTPEPTAAATDAPDNGGGGDGMVMGEPAADYYASICAACHGQAREGVSGLGLPLTPDALTESDDFYADTIRNGRSGTAMVAWGGGDELSDDELDTLITWLKTDQP